MNSHPQLLNEAQFAKLSGVSRRALQLARAQHRELPGVVLRMMRIDTHCVPVYDADRWRAHRAHLEASLVITR